MVRVKICGITSIEDATAAVEAGADALGFVLTTSPRQVDIKQIHGILEALPPMVSTVGVFADIDIEEAFKLWRASRLNYAQICGLHGVLQDFVTPGVSEGFGWHRVIRTLRMGSEDDIMREAQHLFGMYGSALLLDAHVEGKPGGTGETFDWNLAVRAKSFGKPIILAGGLTPANVGEAVSKVSPYAVDVSSGVEVSPGKKDHNKIREFVQNAKRAG